MAAAPAAFGAPTGARYRGGAIRRNLLGKIAPNRGIILIYFFLIGGRSQVADFGHFFCRTVQNHASLGLTADLGHVWAARGNGARGKDSA